MKFFIVFACALAAASAGLVTPLVYGAQHLPVIGPNGVPVDTADVQLARAAHLAAKVEAQVRNGDLGVVAPVVSTYAAPLVSTYVNPLLSTYSYGVPAVTANGVPLDTPEVAVAKANHFAAHAEALARNGQPAVLLRHRRGIYAAVQSVYAGPQHIPVIGANGVPVDTAEVQHARAAHLVAKAEAQAREGQVSIETAESVPVVANGVPVDTVEVQQAKAAHFAAKAVAQARNGQVAVVAPLAYSAPVAYAAQHVPVIANGVPVDTAEVQQAKAAHFAAKAEAHARNGDYAVVAPVYAAQHVPVIANGVPVDTVEVQQAKAAHFAAKAEAQARSVYGVVAPVYGYAAQHLPVIANGVPVETPEVQLAKVAHFAAHAKAVHGLY